MQLLCRSQHKENSMWLRLLAVLLLLGITSQVGAQPRQTAIDDLMTDYVIKHGFMGTILVADKGEIVFVKGYGLADVEQNIPNSPETKFMIGSITKQFTAMLVMQLVERGVLSLNDKLSQFLPSFPGEIGDKITIEMLLSHRSGLPFPEGIERYYYATKKDDFLQEFVKQLNEEGLRFEPGDGYGYSNAGYFILGLIIEQVTGKTYEAYSKNRFYNLLAC